MSFRPASQFLRSSVISVIETMNFPENSRRLYTTPERMSDKVEAYQHPL